MRCITVHRVIVENEIVFASYDVRILGRKYSFEYSVYTYAWESRINDVDPFMCHAAELRRLSVVPDDSVSLDAVALWNCVCV